MENREQFVDFDKFCNKCEYQKVDQAKDPCHECLKNPVNTYTNRPVNYKKKEVTEKKVKKTYKNIKK